MGMPGPGTESSTRDDDADVDKQAVVSRLVQHEPILGGLGGTVAIVDAPDWTGASWLLGDIQGDYLPVWPGEIADYVALLNAWGQRTGATEQVAEMGELGIDGVDGHDCWESMQHMAYQGTDATSGASELTQLLVCRECGERYWRRYQATTMTDDQHKEWTTPQYDD